MIRPEFLYIEEADFILLDLYRFGNASSPGWTESDLSKTLWFMKQNGIEMVVANGNGFRFHLSSIPKTQHVEVIKKHPIPMGLRLVKDLRPGRSDHL